MAFPVTLNGRTYTLTDFEGTNYVDGLPDAFEDFVTHAGDIYNSTSTTSNSIGTGSKTFTVEANKPYQAGTPLRIADAAAPSTNFLDTVVTSYSGTTLVVNSIGYGGSGTKTSWTVNIGGAKTVDGTLGLSQGGTGATDAAGARTNIDVYSKADADSRFLNVSGEASNVTMTGDLTVDTNTLFVDSSTNRVGVGTLTPAEELDVSGDAPSVQLSSTNASGRNYGLQSTNAGVFALYDGTAGANRFVISSGGDVAVGTNATNPVGHSKNNFSIADYSSNGFGSITIGGSTALSGGNIGLIDFYNDTAAGPDDVIARISVNRGDSNDSGDLRITTVNAGVESLNALFPEEGGAIFNGSSRADGDFRVESDSATHMLFVDASTNRVGIRSTAPASIFHIDATTAGEAIISLGDDVGTNGGPHGFDFYHDSADSAKSSVYFRTANNTLEFESDAGERTTVFYLDTGQITFNETSRNDADFRVESDGNTHMLFVDAASNAVWVGTNERPTSGVHSTTTLYSQSATNVAGFKTTAIANNHTALGLSRATTAGKLIEFNYNDTTQVGSVSITASATSYNTTSDRRLKDNIEPIADGTEKLMAMNPISHKWIAEPEADAVHGFIAQEMQDIIPEAVSGDPDGEEMMSMDYGRITPVLVAALQDAHKKIETLEARITALESN